MRVARVSASINIGKVMLKTIISQWTIRCLLRWNEPYESGVFVPVVMVMPFLTSCAEQNMLNSLFADINR
jgi:hypothetical protein